MEHSNSSVELLAEKDEAQEHQIPTAWRPIIRSVVSAFVKKDYRLSVCGPGVEKITPEMAAQIRDSIRSYGATLTDLPEDAWKTSTCMWYGTHWDALVDLWTQEEGPSDLTMDVRVTASTAGYTFKIQMVFVP